MVRQRARNTGYDTMGQMANKLKELLERAQARPEEAQEELVHAGLEIEEEYMHTKPASAKNRRAAERKRAWQHIKQLRSQIRPLQPEHNAGIEEEITQP